MSDRRAGETGRLTRWHDLRLRQIFRILKIFHRDLACWRDDIDTAPYRRVVGEIGSEKLLNQYVPVLGVLLHLKIHLGDSQ